MVSSYSSSFYSSFPVNFFSDGFLETTCSRKEASVEMLSVQDVVLKKVFDVENL